MHAGARRVMSALLAILILATGAFAVSYPGEEILANPGALQEEHEALAFAIVKALARYTMDEISSTALSRYVLKDSPAASAIRRFDGGWYPSHKKSAFANERTENWTGNGITEFSCEVYMDLGVNYYGDVVARYDIAYRLDFTCPDPKASADTRWKLKRFTNIAVEPDTVSLEELNALDPGIRVETVTGPTFKGYMVIIEDPSRVYVGSVPQPYSNDKRGWTLDEFYDRTGAAVVLNGGGFADPNGMGKGGKPNGIVVTEGTRRQGHITSRNFGTVIGFDGDDRLIVAEGVSPETVDGFGLRDAVAFSPALIIDGVVVDNGDYRNGLSARSAIGQREDGAVLMLVIDGRQPDSFGADMEGLTQAMLKYGAVNAANLDGGTSTALVLYGQKVNDGSGPDRVSRHMPTAFLVRPLGD